MSEFNFLPDKIVESTDSSGKRIFSEIFSLETWGNLGFLGLILAIFIISAISPIMGIIALLFYIFEINRNPYDLNIIAIIIHGYIIFDSHKGWLLSIIHNLIFEKDTLILIRVISISSLIIHCVLLIFGRILFRLVHYNKIAFFIVICGLAALSYHVSNIFF